MLDHHMQHDIIEHMNSDHGDAVLQYALAFTDGAAARSARITSIDATSIELECFFDAADHGAADRQVQQMTVETRRVVFADTGAGTRIDDAKDARILLIKMAKLARAKLSV